jgi:putative ABC transport system permease protein
LYVTIFTLIGIFILVIAAINYINLATAKSSLRAKEIGIRKVAGAQRYSLVFQLLMESLIICLVSALLGIGLSYLLLPVINELTQKQLQLLNNPMVFVYLSGVTVLIGLIAGIFPALYLSSFKPVSVLKGLKLNEGGALNLRKSLVVVQFTISVALIIGALIIVQQMRYIQSANLGFDKERVLVLRNAWRLSSSDRTSFLNSIKQLTGVENATTSSTVLGQGFSTTRLRAQGSRQEQQLNFTSGGFNYLDVVGIELKEGRGFSENFPTDSLNNGTPGGPLNQRLGGIILNEQAVKEFGLGSPAVGKQLVWDSDADTTYYVEVIGVTKNFHFTSLRNEIKPYGFILTPQRQGNFTIRLSGGEIPATLQQLETLWKKQFPEVPFEYSFLDETFDKMYAAEARFQQVFISLVMLGIIIACLGLFALAAFSAEQRIKEIGIRKVLGASVAQVVALLSKDFLKLVSLSIILAIPIAYYAMQTWLAGFAYRISLQWWIFAASGVIALVIALLTISSQSIKAAVADPVKSLRSE